MVVLVKVQHLRYAEKTVAERKVVVWERVALESIATIAANCPELELVTLGSICDRVAEYIRASLGVTCQKKNITLAAKKMNCR